MKSHVIMFQDRFADKVEKGLKPHTIRGKRKRVINVGDRLSLRKWLGKPYRSKQKILRETVCVRTEPIQINSCGMFIRNAPLPMTVEGCNSLAINDGFANAREMIQWFRDTHGLPFEGVLIEWNVD